MQSLGMKPQSIRDFDDYSKFPVLTRSALRREGANLLSSLAETKTLRKVNSSGSTGERVELFQDSSFSRWCRAHQLRTYGWCGLWQLGDPFALVWGGTSYLKYRGRYVRLDNALSNRIELDAFRLDAASQERLLKLLEKHNPVLISGYTTALYLLAKLARKRGAIFPRLRAVQATAEQLTDDMRSEIEQGFHCEVYNKYGSIETNIIAHESADHLGMRIQAEHTLVEIVDSAGHPCPPGVLGRIIVTTLNNSAMPLLRYETSDFAAFAKDRTATDGVKLPLMGPVVGRLQDVLCTPDGGLIHPQLFTNVLRQYAEIEWFQIVQEQEQRLRIRVVTPYGLSDETMRHVRIAINHACQFEFRTDFEVLSEMPESATGKFRISLNEIPSARQDSELRALKAVQANSGPERIEGPDA
jgi:phenylacetate-CoA ligase